MRKGECSTGVVVVYSSVQRGRSMRSMAPAARV